MPPHTHTITKKKPSSKNSYVKNPLSRKLQHAIKNLHTRIKPFNQIGEV